MFVFKCFCYVYQVCLLWILMMDSTCDEFVMQLYFVFEQMWCMFMVDVYDVIGGIFNVVQMVIWDELRFRVEVCDTSIDAGKELVQILKEGDVVYMKGSQSVRMERAVKMILKETHDPKHVLVRQEGEWLQRQK